MYATFLNSIGQFLSSICCNVCFRNTGRSRLKVGEDQPRRLSVLSVNYYAGVHGARPGSELADGPIRGTFTKSALSSVSDRLRSLLIYVVCYGFSNPALHVCEITRKDKECMV